MIFVLHLYVVAVDSAAISTDLDVMTSVVVMPFVISTLNAAFQFGMLNVLHPYQERADDRLAQLCQLQRRRRLLQARASIVLQHHAAAGAWPAACLQQQVRGRASSRGQKGATRCTCIPAGTVLGPAYPYAAPTTCIPLCIHATAFILYKHFSQPLAIMASGVQQIMGQRC